MPQFAPRQVKTAVAPITVKPAGLDCSSELYLVSNSTKVATAGIKSFISTGAKQDISFPITMPSAEGTYHVFIDIYAEGLLIAAYQATEDVVIRAVGPHFLYFKVYPSWAAGSISIEPDRPMEEVGPGFPDLFITSGWNLGDIVTMTAHPNPGFSFYYFLVAQPGVPEHLYLWQTPASFKVIGNSTILLYLIEAGEPPAEEPPVAPGVMRPNAPGDEENIQYATSGVGNHHLDVDEVTPDELATYVANQSIAVWQRDLYKLPVPSGIGTINSVTVHARARHNLGFGTASLLKIALKAGGVVYESPEKILTSPSWGNHSEQWNTNPKTGLAWTWGEISVLQIGISLKAFWYTGVPTQWIQSQCTQVYVEVDCTLG